ncbi:hypothetical protein BSKO_04084 [Bryopsis sp. KO-2023]|nr:hypothetical protein BSKO_04084 [Bryopsis sp. KO-2023]
MAVQLDAQNFCARLKLLYESWKNSPEVWNDASTLAIVSGSSSNDEFRYLKSVSIHLWLFGYEIPDTVMVLSPDEAHVLSTVKKISYLKPLQSKCESEVGIKLVLHTKSKSDDGASMIETLISLIKGQGAKARVGTLTKEHPTGKICDLWMNGVGEIKENLVDVSLGIAGLLACKNSSEVVNVKKAALLASKVMKDFIVQKMEAILDDDKQVKHSKLAAMTENMVRDPQKIGVKLRADNCDVAFPPVFQSGGKYDMKLTAVSDEDPLKADAMLFSLGTRYSSYCSIISRCYLVDPEKKMEEEYGALLAAQEAAISSLVEGAPINSARKAAVRVLQEKKMEFLVEKLPKSIGFGMGTEIRETSLSLTENNERIVRPGMVFNVSLGVTGLEWPKKSGKKLPKEYAFVIADTVVVQEGGKAPEVLTIGCPKTWNNVAYSLDDVEEEPRPSPKPAPKEEVLGPRRRDLRTEVPNYNNKEQQRKDIQNSLQEIKNQETLQRLMAGKDALNGNATTSGRNITDITAYKNQTEIPNLGDLVITVDQRNECVLVPLLGVMVPFHVTTIKNIGHQVDGDHAHIRINFYFSGNYQPATKFPKQVFLKELSFRTSNVKHGSKIVQEIKVLRSSVLQRNKEAAERATLVRQEKLMKGKRVFRLPDLWIRPSLGGKGKKMSGVLEAHHNGFRYNAPRSEFLDIMYRNIRFAFFQPADNEMITILHFHLINPIMVGKKKTKDVQFYAEVMDVVQTLEGSRRSAYDPDEIEEEQRERDRCNRINKEFQIFVKRVQEHWETEFSDLRLEFDIPFRDLGFNGVPHKSNVFLMPTMNCLVELVEMPFTVVALEDIEIVNLERVGFNLKNFDMAIVFKDFNRDVMHCYTISSQSLDTIKEWLTQVKIKYYETKSNLAWKNILKKIMDDPQAFFEDGGWKFLDMDASDSGDEMSENNSEFQPDSDEMEESSDYESSDNESLVDSDAGDSEADSEEDADEEGMTWDQLEEQAKRDDREKQYTDDSDDEYRKRTQKRKMGQSMGGGKRPRQF